MVYRCIYRWYSAQFSFLGYPLSNDFLEYYLFCLPTDILIITFSTSFMLSVKFAILSSFSLLIRSRYSRLFMGYILLLFNFYFYWETPEFCVY
jgi:hypothetical protein